MYIYTVTVACVSIILVFVSLSSLLASLRQKILTLTSLSFHLSISPPISPQAIDLTDLTHRRYDPNRQTTMH